MSNHIYIKEINDKVAYDNFVSKHKNGNLLQSFEWGKIKSEWNRKYFEVTKDNIVVGMFLLLERKINRLFKIGYVPRGPIIDFEDTDVLNEVLNFLKIYTKKNKLIFLKFDPKITLRSGKLSEISNQEINPSAMDIAKHIENQNVIYSGLTKDMADTFQPRFEAVINYDSDFEKNMKSNTKKIVKKARNRKIDIEFYDISKIEEFDALVEKTRQRQKVNLRSLRYFKLLMETYPDSSILSFATLDTLKVKNEVKEEINELTIQLNALSDSSKQKKRELSERIDSNRKYLEYLADISDEKIYLAGMLNVGYGDTFEMLYSGFDDKFQNLNAQYLLDAESTKYAFERGYKVINMGGVDNSLSDGLSIYKNHFDVDIIEYAGEFTIVGKPLMYKLLTKALEMRRK